MNNRNLYLVYILIFIVSTACSWTPFKTRPVFATRDECKMSSKAQISENTSSWTWLGVTVGASIEQDLITKFGEPDAIHFEQEVPQVVCTYFYHTLDNGDAVTFWLADGKVIGIDLWEPAHQLLTDERVTIDDAKALYGRPELVGWSKVYGAGYRAVVWLDQGVMAQVSLRWNNGKTAISNATYFSPMTEEEFASSPWARFILDKPNLNTDYVDYGPQDPFEW
jgi:hypothetical protein